MMVVNKEESCEDRAMRDSFPAQQKPCCSASCAHSPLTKVQSVGSAVTLHTIPELTLQVPSSVRR